MQLIYKIKQIGYYIFPFIGLIFFIWARLGTAKDIREGKRSILLYILHTLAMPFIVLFIFVCLGILIELSK